MFRCRLTFLALCAASALLPLACGGGSPDAEGRPPGAETPDASGAPDASSTGPREAGVDASSDAGKKADAAATCAATPSSLVPGPVLSLPATSGGRVAARRAAFDQAGGLHVVAHARGAMTLAGQTLPERGTDSLEDLVLINYGPLGNVTSALRPSEGGSFLIDPSSADVLVDSAGHVVIGGSFRGAADFGNGAVVAPGETAFVALYEPGGALVRLLSFPSASGTSSVNKLAQRAPDRFVLTGRVSGQVDVGGHLLTAHADADWLMAEVDANGTVAYARAFGDAAPGGTSPQLGYGVTLDGQGRSWHTGFMEAQVSFGGGPVGTTSGGPTIPLVVLDAAGNHVRSAAFGLAQLSHRAGLWITDSACDDAIVLAGSDDGAMDYGSGVTVQDRSLVATKFGVDGDLRWALRVAPRLASYAEAAAVTVLPSGAIVVAAYLEGSMTIGAVTYGSDADPATGKARGQGWLLLLVTPDGVVKHAQYTQNERPWGIARNGASEIAVVGETLGLGATGGFVRRYTASP